MYYHPTHKRKIRIKNFRSLVMEDFIEIKPITLLLGKNGAGKSSFLKALDFFRKNIIPPKFDFTRYSIPSGVDLNNFEEIVINNDKSKNIIIEFVDEKSVKNDERESKLNYSITAEWTYSSSNKNLKEIKILDKSEGSFFKLLPFTGRFKNAQEARDYFSDNYLQLVGEKLSYSPESNELINLGREVNFGSNIDIEMNKNFIVQSFHPLPLFPKKENDPDFIRSLFENSEFLQKYSDEFDSFVRRFYCEIPDSVKEFFSFCYVEPIRNKPLNEYKLQNGRFSPDDYYGLLNYWELAKDPWDYFFLPEKLMDFMNESIQNFEIGNRFDTVKENDIGYGIIESKDGTRFNFANSNSGTTQLLPIIIGAYRAGYDYELYTAPLSGSDVLIIEQPELHLHPGLQAKLAEFIVNGWNTFILETHSEHIIRKIQVLIAQKKLNKERVAVYYFDKDKETGITLIEKMELDEKGRFKKEWPDGFFDTDIQNTLDFLSAINKN